MDDHGAENERFGRFAEWKREPPPRRPSRLPVIAGVAAGVVLLGYGGFRAVELWNSPSESTEEPRPRYGAFAPRLLRPGDCFNEPVIEDAVRTGTRPAGELPIVTVIPCEDPHTAEVFLLFEIDSGLEYPTDAAVADAADACDEGLLDYVTSDDDARGVSVWYDPPSPWAWEHGYDHGVCFAVTRTAEKRRGTLAE